MSRRTIPAAPAVLALLSLIATPAAAADVPVTAPRISAVAVSPAWKPGDDRAADRGWGRRGHWDHDRGRVDAGDVLAGILIIGGIAAIASAATRNNREREPVDYRYPDRNGGDYRYRDQQDRSGGWTNDGEARGLNRAVEMCVQEIERNQRVDSVNSVDRNGAGWTVTGSLFNGAGFTCSIGANGRIEHLDTGDRYRSGEAGATSSGENRQWGDDRYMAERARMDNAGSEAEIAKAPDTAQPAYPGGPLPGEETADSNPSGSTG